MFHITAIAVMPPNIKIVNYCYSSSVRQCVKINIINTLFFLKIKSIYGNTNSKINYFSSFINKHIVKHT